MHKVMILRYLGSHIILQLCHNIHEWAIEDSTLGNIIVSLSIWGRGRGVLLGEVVIFSRRGVWCGVGWGGGLR